MLTKISVLMCTYNETSKEIDEAIQSILNQTYTDFEFIIVCDNPDNYAMQEILDEYAKTDRRIKIIVNEHNKGLAESLNVGLMVASGEYVARMDADDISLPERLMKQMDYLDQNPSCVIVSAQREDMDEEGNTIDCAPPCLLSDREILEMLPYCSVITHPAVMFRKKEICDIGMYRNIRVAEDYDLWLRALTAGYCFHIMNDKLLRYRHRQNSITNSNLYRMYMYHTYIVEKYHQRRKTGKDTFSIRELEEWLKKKKVYDNRYCRKINCQYTISMSYMRGNIVDKCAGLLYMFFHPRTISYVYKSAVIKLLLRKRGTK